MLTLAKMCQENSEYTDCIIQCGDFAHNEGTREEREKDRYYIVNLGLSGEQGSD